MPDKTIKVPDKKQNKKPIKGYIAVFYIDKEDSREIVNELQIIAKKYNIRVDFA